MPKRPSDEERILRFFDEAPLPAAEVLLKLVRGRMKDRRSSARVLAMGRSEGRRSADDAAEPEEAAR